MDLNNLPGIRKITELSREEAIKQYRGIGGVVKEENGRITYPDKQRVKTQLEFAEEKSEFLGGLLKELEKRQNSHEYDSSINVLGRAVDPLYWEHLMKFYSDSDYREAFEMVEPPVGRIHDEKWRSVMRMFVKNEQYRKNLIEAKTGLLGQNQGTMKQRLEVTLKSNREMMQSRRDKIAVEKEGFDKKVRVLRSLYNWTD